MSATYCLMFHDFVDRSYNGLCQLRIYPLYLQFTLKSTELFSCAEKAENILDTTCIFTLHFSQKYLSVK